MARFNGSGPAIDMATARKGLRLLVSLLRAWSSDWGGLLALGAALYLLVYQAWTIQPWSGDEHRALIANVISVPLSLVAVALSARASRHPRLDAATRRGWLLMTLAQIGYLVGNLLWFHAEMILGVAPFPSWADAAYLTFYPLVFLAVLSFPKRQLSRDERTRFGLDVATILIGSGMLVWHLLLRPLTLDQTADALATLLSASYIVGDLVLVFAIVVVLLRQPARASREALGLTIGGLALFLVADVAFAVMELLGLYRTGDWPDGLWGAAIYFMLLGAQYQWRRASEEPGQARHDGALPNWTGWLPYAAVATGFGLLLTAALDGGPEPLLALALGAAALTGLVIARQVILLRENERLLAQRSALAETLAGREARFRLAAECASDLIYEWEIATGRLIWFGDIDGRLGYAPGALPRTLEAWEAVIHPEDRPRVLEALWRHQAAGSLFKAEYRVLCPDGRALIWLDRGMPLKNETGATMTYVGVTTDVTERKRAEALLAHQAFHDALTGLPNRALLADHLERGLARARRHGRQVALLFLDLDNFKLVNDSLGHEASDHALIGVAARLRTAVRAGDTVARHGGDEFIVLMTDLDEPNEAAMVADRVLAHLRAPFRIAGQEFTLSASIGIALSDGQHDGPDALLRGADSAVYHAKRAGKSCYQVFEPSMSARAANRLELERELRLALDRDEFETHYQPIVDLATGQPRAVEALLRWRHPRHGLLLPEAFLTVAEETGLIVPIGQWLLRQACQQAREWSVTCSGEPLMLTVNLSAREFQRPALVADIASCLDAHCLPPAGLMLEVTEALMVEDMEVALATLRDLKALGIHLALDDFGTGYSSLSCVKRCPLDMLKIDRAFVRGLEQDPENQTLTRALLAAADALALVTIAEGIETPTQMAFLREMGCRMGQGYLIAAPAPPEVFMAWLAERVTIGLLATD